MKPPLWYTAREITEWLNGIGWPNKHDLPVFLAYNFQKAFEKGWRLAESKKTYTETTPEE